MAKKKNKSNSGKILSVVAAILGLVAICMIFVATIKVPDTEVWGKVVEGKAYTGLQVVFGYKTEDVSVFNFSIMALLPYLLIIAGVVFAALSAKAKKVNKGLDLVTAGLFVVAGVLCFLMPSFVSYADTLLGKLAGEIDYEITTGAIVSAILSIGAGVLSLFKAVK